MRTLLLIGMLAALGSAQAEKSALERGLDKTGQAIERGAQSTGRALDRAGNSVAKGAEKVHKKVDDKVRPKK